MSFHTQLTRRQMALEQQGKRFEPPEDLPERPRVRGQCQNGPRPCPWVSCRYNLFLHVTDAGALQFPGGHVEFEQTDEDTCALDVAERGPHTRDEIGPFFHLSRERVRQIEHQALRKLKDDPVADC